MNEATKKALIKDLTAFQKRKLPLKVRGENKGKPKWLVVSVKKFKSCLNLVLTLDRSMLFQIKASGMNGLNIPDKESLLKLKPILDKEVYTYMNERMELLMSLSGAIEGSTDTSSMDI